MYFFLIPNFYKAVSQLAPGKLVFVHSHKPNIASTITGHMGTTAHIFTNDTLQLCTLASKY